MSTVNDKERKEKVEELSRNLLEYIAAISPKIDTVVNALILILSATIVDEDKRYNVETIDDACAALRASYNNFREDA